MRNKSNLNYRVVFLLLACTFLMVSCQQQANDENFQILIFSSISEASLKDMKELAKAESETNMSIDIAIYPPVVERLIIEIVQHSGDLLIMDRDLLAAAYDSKELYQLEELRNSENTIELTEFELEALKAAGEEAEIGDIYLNALRVILNETDSESSELVAIIPKYIKNKEVAFLILEKIIQK